MREALEHVMLTNVVPFKPIGNKAYPAPIRERFRPFVARLLTRCWSGDTVITLGNEAFHWFLPYSEPGALEEMWARPDRYECTVVCTIESDGVARRINVAPLPHPSPLNATWFAAFPGLLEKRLKAVFP
jgi:uracil-DNA glycosylase